MITWACLCLALAIETPGEMPRETPSDLIATVETALEKDLSSLGHHRGYIEFLASNPAMARAEEAWQELSLQPEFAAADRAFDEALNRDPAAQALFDQFYDHFEAHPELLPELAETFEQITGNPLAQLRVSPWWQQWSAFDARNNGVYRALLEDFAQRPTHFRVWHQRQLALAADVQARAWIRYWHRRVRRVPALSSDNAYLRYLQSLRKQPESAARAESRWMKEHGPSAPWPPKEAPPLLSGPALRDKAAGTPKDRVRVPTIERPQKPELRRSERYSGPTMPGKPLMPEKPAMPRRPTPPE
jgi:hypothetical protein